MSRGNDDIARFSAVGHHRRIDSVNGILQKMRSELEGASETQRLDIIDRYLIKYPRYATTIRESLNAGVHQVKDVVDAENTVITRAPAAAPVEDDSQKTPVPAADEDQKVTGIIGKLQNVPRVDLPIGAPRFLGEYRVIKELGRGGMGVVYLGVDDNISRYVAIKVLPAEYGQQQEYLERFRREQDAVSKLQHPGIISVYANGEQEGLHYFVMQFVRGVSLGEWFKRYWQSNGIPFKDEASGASTTNGEFGVINPQESQHSATAKMVDSLELGDLLHIVERTAQALHFAHQNGVLHRDVKPGNIVIDEEGNPILLDFGLARQENEKTITKSGNILGTVPYMSPEQVTARKSMTDHRTDLYALGVILYEGLTGQRPFHSDKLESLMVMIISKEARPPSEINPELGENIDTVVLKCLEKRPHNRFANCEALAEELGRIRAHRSILSEPVGRLGRLMRWAANNRMQAAFGAVVIASVLFLIAFLVQGEVAERQQARKSAQDQAKQARAFLVAAATTATEEEEVGNKRKAAMGGVQNYETAMVLQDLSRQSRSLKAERFRLCQNAVARFDESLKILDADSLKEERVAALQEWLRAAEDVGDPDACELIAARLHDEGADADLRSTGFVSLTTNPAGAAVKARMWRPSGDGRLELSEDVVDLGVTPLERVELPIGSWKFEVTHADSHPITYPVLIERGEHWGDSGWHDGRFADKNWRVDLPPATSYDSDRWVFVAGGPFQETYPRFYKELDCQLRWSWEDSFVIARREFTFGEYLPVFQKIMTLESRMPTSDRLNFAPGFYAQGKPEPRVIVGDDLEVEVIDYGGRSPEEFMASAVCGIRGRSAFIFPQIATAVNNQPVALPFGRQWEKAARGVDGRVFPWGSGFDWSFTGGRRSQEKPLAEGSVTWPPGTWPIDTSPYGCLDMSGNAAEWCRNRSPQGPALFTCGGMLMNTMATYFSAWPREPVSYDLFLDHTGFRLTLELQ